MQTASQIATEFSTREITVNFQASEILIDSDFSYDPIPNIEFCKNDRNFEKMKQNLKD